MNVKRFWSGMLALVAALLAVVIYGPSFRAPFQLDDYFVIVANPVILQLAPLSAIWAWDPSRFLAYCSFAVNHQLNGLDPLGYHLVNFVLHLLVAGMVYALVLVLLKANGKTERPSQLMALFAAFIFMAHPLQTSAVTYVAQRSTLLATLFYLGVVFCFIRFRSENNIRYYLLALFSAGLGVLSKPIVMTLPLVLFLYELTWPGVERRWGRRILAILPFVFLACVVPLLLWAMHQHHFGVSRLLDISRETVTISRGEYLFTQFRVIWTYLRLLIFPVNQNLDYDYPIVHDLCDPATLLAGWGLLTVCWLGFEIWRRDKLIGFGIGWFFLTLSLESSIFPISDVIFEHRLYLPLFGFALVVAGALLRFVPGKISKVFLIFMILIFSGLTLSRNWVWSDRIRFLEDVVSKSPRKARVYNNLAIAYAEEGEYGKALATLQQLIQLAPNDIQAYNNRANIYRITGQLDLAIKEYDFILSRAPGYVFAYYFRSQSWAAKKEYGKALADALAAQKLGFPVAEEYLSVLKSGK